MLSHLYHFFSVRRHVAVGVAFVSLGLLYGTWATVIPLMKTRFELDDAQLGLLLLCMPFGAMVFNPIAAMLLNRFGVVRTHLAALVVLPLAFTLMTLPTHLYLVGVCLWIAGMGISFLNIAMNTLATAIEVSYKVNILSTCHGLFSVGLMLGSMSTGVLLNYGLGMSGSMALHAAFVVAGALVTGRILQQTSLKETEKHEEKPKGFQWPTAALWLMIAISICTNITEGAMADWAAVYMKEVVNPPVMYLGWGLAGYSALMAAGRFLGDALIPRVGRNRILVAGGILAALGLCLAIVVPSTLTTIIGFGMVGAGVSCGAPILYGSAARVPNLAKGAGLATLNTFSMSGFLLGPVVIGFISHATSLPAAFGVIGSLALLWALLSKRAKLY